MKKVLIFGAFDLLHPGHLYLIQQAKKHGEVHVCLALDETIKKVKGRPPVYTLRERQKNLEQFGVTVHPGRSSDKLEVFKELQPEIVVLGYDQRVFVPELKADIRAHKLSTKVIELPSFRADIFKSKKIRKAIEDPNGGFLLVDKPEGQPSFRTVVELRRLTGIRQIGFAGTLDPLATGLLICGIGAATTLLDWWHLFPKTYEATARLGFISDTFDSEGVMTKQSDLVPSHEQVHAVLKQFTGPLLQKPPIYSAKKVKGSKMYELARQGKAIEPKEQTVTIHTIELLSYVYPEVRIRVSCSSGTYIRSLIHDIGQALGTSALMSELRRTAIGDYTVRQATAVEQLQKDGWRKHLISVAQLQHEVIEFLFPKV